MNMPGVEYTASEEIKVASSTNGQTFTILVPLLAPVVIDNEENDELVTITVRMPAEGVREFLNSTRRGKRRLAQKTLRARTLAHLQLKGPSDRSRNPGSGPKKAHDSFSPHPPGCLFLP